MKLVAVFIGLTFALLFKSIHLAFILIFGVLWAATAGKSQAEMYTRATLVLLLLIWPYLRLADSGRSYLIHLMYHLPFMFLGPTGFDLSKVRPNLIADVFAVAVNPGFVAGVIVGWKSVRDFPSAARGVIPATLAIGVLFLLGFILTIGGGDNDMGGLWVMGPIAAAVFLPFGWIGAIAGWKGAELYERRTTSPN